MAADKASSKAKRAFIFLSSADSNAVNALDTCLAEETFLLHLPNRIKHSDPSVSLTCLKRLADLVKRDVRVATLLDESLNKKPCGIDVVRVVSVAFVGDFHFRILCVS